MKQSDSSDSSLNRPSESLSEDISDEDGVAGGHLFGVQLPGRVGDLDSLLRCPYRQETNKGSANKKWQQPKTY